MKRVITIIGIGSDRDEYHQRLQQIGRQHLDDGLHKQRGYERRSARVPLNVKVAV